MVQKENLWITEELLRWIVDQLRSTAKAATIHSAPAGNPTASSSLKAARIHAGKPTLGHRLLLDR
jgi:hypothetical protein